MEGTGDGKLEQGLKREETGEIFKRMGEKRERGRKGGRGDTSTNDECAGSESGKKRRDPGHG